MYSVDYHEKSTYNFVKHPSLATQGYCRILIAVYGTLGAAHPRVLEGLIIQLINIYNPHRFKLPENQRSKYMQRQY